MRLCDEAVGEISALPPPLDPAEHVSAAQRGAREAALQTLALEPRLLMALGAERRVPEAVAQVCMGAVAVPGRSCAWIGSPCLRHCVHGAPIGVRRRGGAVRGAGRPG
eukprot:COSAG01_NODE_7068_length_3366_cov_8.453350_1_plen_108_part_00